MSAAQSWFAIRKPITNGRAATLKLLAFLIPLAVWCLVSYCSYVWHPQIEVTDKGASDFLQVGNRLNAKDFYEENARLLAEDKKPASGSPSNPVFLPAPHEVGRAFYSAFITPPQRRGDPWLHESLWHSAQIIFYGFSLAALCGVPLGILCGTFDFFSKMSEPFVDFIRYMPAPVFGALAVAVLGIDDGPKIAIIFMGTFFNLVLVVANTTRSLDPALLEAALTLGAKRTGLIAHVILPGILPNLYRDLRILIGCAWTLLTVAELIGASSGISFFINQQGKYRHYDNVFAGIVMIGMIGFFCDQLLGFLGSLLFPWQADTNHAALRWLRWTRSKIWPGKMPRTVPAIAVPAAQTSEVIVSGSAEAIQKSELTRVRP